MSKALYHLRGILKKGKVLDDVFCVATSVEDAIAQCESFADELKLIKISELGPGWHT